MQRWEIVEIALGVVHQAVRESTLETVEVRLPYVLTSDVRETVLEELRKIYDSATPTEVLGATFITISGNKNASAAKRQARIQRYISEIQHQLKDQTVNSRGVLVATYAPVEFQEELIASLQKLGWKRVKATAFEASDDNHIKARVRLDLFLDQEEQATQIIRPGEALDSLPTILQLSVR